MYIINLLYYKINTVKVKLRALFLNRKIQGRYKSRLIYSLAKRLASKSKWGISYSVFDGEELLEASLKSVRKSANYINVVYQKKSWYGENATENIQSFLEEFKRKGLIDELIEYKPNYKMSAGKQELKKRNIGLKYVKKAKCDFFMSMDCDEFYFSNELENCKTKICKRDITNAYCCQKIYLDQNKQFKNRHNCAVSLFAKINKFSKLKQNKQNIIQVDPTRQISRIFNKKELVLTDIFMHHYTMLRKNIDKKIRNSSGEITVNKITETFDVENYFEIPKF